MKNLNFKDFRMKNFREMRGKLIAAGAGIAALALFSVALTMPRGGGAPAAVRTASATQEAVTVPTGTRIHIRLENAVSTKSNSSGDRFSATLDGPLTVDDKVLAPSRSKIVGQLTQVTQSGRIKGRARMTMVLRKMVVDNKEYDLSTRPLTLVAPSTKKRDALLIAGSSAFGAIIGALAGAGKGAAIGAGIGGGSGTGFVLATRGKPVAYGPEARFTFTLAEPMQLPAHSKAG